MTLIKSANLNLNTLRKSSPGIFTYFILLTNCDHNFLNIMYACKTKTDLDPKRKLSAPNIYEVIYELQFFKRKSSTSPTCVWRGMSSYELLAYCCSNDIQVLAKIYLLTPLLQCSSVIDLSSAHYDLLFHIWLQRRPTTSIYCTLCQVLLSPINKHRTRCEKKLVDETFLVNMYQFSSIYDLRWILLSCSCTIVNICQFSIEMWFISSSTPAQFYLIKRNGELCQQQIITGRASYMFLVLNI